MKWITKWNVIAGLLTLSLLAPSVALAEHPAGKVVQNTATQVMQRLRAEKQQLDANPDRIYALVYEMILPHFDFDGMSKWVLGRYWNQASPEQQQQFTQEFQTLLVRTYARALLEYSEQDIQFEPVNAGADDRLVTVRTEVQQSGTTTIPINYTMHQIDNAWKVIDVSVNGVSLVSTYRGSFASEIRRNGLDTLLQKLAERNADTVAATEAAQATQTDAAE